MRPVRVSEIEEVRRTRNRIWDAVISVLGLIIGTVCVLAPLDWVGKAAVIAAGVFVVVVGELLVA
ncbi:hypothetical protein LQL77_32840, partial [Rhodococcus cerastii]|nr:hypothetical protein [Rhodococcus cerastii]